MQSVYERYKEQIEQEIKSCDIDIREYWANTDPKYVNALNQAFIDKYNLEIILKFLEENKEVLDK